LSFGVKSLNPVESWPIDQVRPPPAWRGRRNLDRQQQTQPMIWHRHPFPSAAEYHRTANLNWLDGDARGGVKDTLRGTPPSGQCAGLAKVVRADPISDTRNGLSAAAALPDFARRIRLFCTHNDRRIAPPASIDIPHRSDGQAMNPPGQDGSSRHRGFPTSRKEAANSKNSEHVWLRILGTADARRA